MIKRKMSQRRKMIKKEKKKKEPPKDYMAEPYEGLTDRL